MTTRMQRFGRAAQVMAAAIVVAALLLALGATNAGAEQKYETNVGQNTFVKGCRKTGGAPSRVAPRTVKCDHGDGSSTTCNFSTDPATCTYVSAFVPQPAGDHIDPNDVAGAEGGSSPNGSGDLRGSTTSIGTSPGEYDRES